MKTRRFLVVVMLLFAFAAPVGGDDLAASVDSLTNRAAHGEADAQFFLSLIYTVGEYVPQDYVQAHKWFNLAAATYTEKEDRDKAVKARDCVAARMTPAQITEAQKLAREWKSNRRRRRYSD